MSRKALTILIALTPATVLAQQVQMREISRSAAQIVLTVDASWSHTLEAAVDSLSADTLFATSIYALAGGEPLVSTTIALPFGVVPGASVRSASYDEADIDAHVSPDLAAALAKQPVNVVGVGRLRRQRVGSVEARLVSFDSDRRVLRRIRNMEIVVELSPGVPSARKEGSIRANPHLGVERSVLADGTVFKIPIERDGVYLIDRQFLTELGMQPDAIDPNAVRIFTNGGAPLPALNSARRTPDLAERAVHVVGGGDGVFGAGDAVMFFADGPLSWRYDSTRTKWIHTTNPFTRTSFAFLQIGAGDNLRPAPERDNPVAGATRRDTHLGRFVIDFEEFIWSKEHGSGLTWVSRPIRVGGRLDILSGLRLPGLVPGEIDFDVNVAIRSNPIATVSFSDATGQTVAEVRARFSVGSGAEDPSASPTEATFSQTVTGGPISLSMQVLPQINDPQAGLDFLRVFYTRQNRAENGMLVFHTGEDAGSLEYALSGFASVPIVYDITDPATMRRLGAWQNGSGHITQVDVPAGQLPRQIVAFEPSAAQRLEATAAVPVPNQNLHGIASFPDFVIFTAADFLASANALADHRRAEGLDVVVLDVEQVYNEFSGGVRDMRAPRDYLKFLYDRATDESQLPRYALFFGDGHYDFRNLREENAGRPNYVLPYETNDSFNPDATYTSDDYFGLLDDDEGIWKYDGFGAPTFERVDIGIGRLPVQSPDQAALLVQKIKDYESSDTYGPWRARYTFVADDAFTGRSGSDAEFDLHMYNVDFIAQLIKSEIYPQINTQKIYAESFERVFVNEFRVPGAKKAMLSALEDGVLVMNYMGHGGPRGLAQEELFTTADAIALNNRDRLTIFVTATCSFGWWDIDDTDSGAELLLWNPNGGAVAMLTTVRVVYTSPSPNSLNPGLNRALNEAMFRFDAEGRPVRLGDAMVETKNTSVGLVGNSRKFNLLGDPTMRLGIPSANVVVESVNGVNLDEMDGNLRALDRVTIAGSVRASDGGVDSGFNGSLNLTVFDAERGIPIRFRRWMPTPDYQVREDLIWRGDVVVTAGQFAATFVVPKDISYSNRSGRISTYAMNADGHAIGFAENVLVGGTSDSPPDDAVGPELTLFLNDTTFVDGGLTTANPEMIVRLFDDSGINTVGAGVGHEMLLVVNGDDNSALDIASAFQSDANSYQRGQVRWPLNNLPNGPGNLSVRAWDVLNNSTTAELNFVVSASESLELRNIFNYPNPMSSRTRFVFEHNQLPGTAADVEIRIYTLNGRPIRTITSEEALPSGVLTSGPVSVQWDGRDDDLDQLATGVYLYKVRVAIEDEAGGRDVVERIEKIALIR